MADLALSAVDKVLGQLVSAIRDEAQLLGRVQGDVQFIMEEMESMDALLRHLTAGGSEGEHGHQIRAWMKQVMDLAHDSKDCIDRYVKRVGGPRPRAEGLRSYLKWRARRFLWSMPACHQAANEIQHLKTRAREVGERQQRYGVPVPSSKPPEGPERKVIREPAGEERQRQPKETTAYRRSLLDINILKEGKEELFDWLDESLAPDGQPPGLVSIVSPDKENGDELARHVYERSSSTFGCRARITLEMLPFLDDIYWSMFNQLFPAHDVESSSMAIKEKLKEQLQGKRFLLVFGGLVHPSLWTLLWDQIEKDLDLHSHRSTTRSAVIMTNKIDTELTKRVDIVITHSLVSYFCKRAARLLQDKYDDANLEGATKIILKECGSDQVCMKMFLHILCANPDMTEQELGSLYARLHLEQSSSVRKRERLIMYCYQGLPVYDQCCFQYLMTAFPKNATIRRTSLVRRWVAEGLITVEDDRRSTLGEAEDCFDEILTRGLICAVDMGATGKVKTCKLHDSVLDMRAKIARDVNFLDMELPHLDLDRHFAIRNGIQLHSSGNFIQFLESLPVSSRLRLLRALDLESCQGLGRHHLKNICKILQLKYLSLRNTDVSHLPKQINNLKQLETLDIRQTKVCKSATKAILLPMLKHLLAGSVHCSSDDAIKSEESFSTVRVPSRISRMKNMEILSHVEIKHVAKELKDVGVHLRKLRKLGVVIHGNKDNIEHLLQLIKKLNKSLCSLSICFRPLDSVSENLDLNPTENADQFKPPESLESLKIRGLIRRLPCWIKDLDNLQKITLRETSLTNDDMRILGNLYYLRCLKLRYKSYTESTLVFKEREFVNLKLLVLEGSDITNIRFDIREDDELEKIVWSFTRMDTITGLDNLPNLKELAFEGDFNPDPVEQAIAGHPNEPVFRYKFPDAHKSGGRVCVSAHSEERASCVPSSESSVC